MSRPPGSPSSASSPASRRCSTRRRSALPPGTPTQTDGVIGAPDRGSGCSAQDGGAWSVCIGHKHQGGAAVKHFAGLDVSLEETAICVVDEEGRIVKEARVASEPEALVAFLRGLGLTLERIGL